MTTLPDIVTIPAFEPEPAVRRAERTLRRAPQPRVRFAGEVRAARASRPAPAYDAQPLGMVILLVK